MAVERIDEEFVDEGFGFPVVLRNVPMVKVRGIWTPKLDYNELTRSVVLALASKPGRLTGSEIRFIRQYFEMTLTGFGAYFDVSHSAVLKWQNFANEPPSLKWPIEKDIRLFILDQLGEGGKAFKDLYASLRNTAREPNAPVAIDIAA